METTASTVTILVAGMPGETAEILNSLAPRNRSGRAGAVQRIYDDLRRHVLDFTLEPGAILSTKDLAAGYEVSPTPVREALILLEQEGLVDIVPQSRTSVSLIDIQHAWETHFLRLSVEIEVARQLSQSISEQGLAELRTWIDRQEVELAAGNQNDFNVADLQFHETLFRLAGVDGLTRLLNTRRGHYDRIRRLYLLVQERREVVVKEHRMLLAAFADRDEGAAEAAVRLHLGKSLAIVDEIRNRHPGFFS